VKFGKIMIIDNDVEFLDELKHSLISNGRCVIALQSGERAVEKAVSEKPDLIIIEFSAGPRGGIRIAEKLKSRSETSKIPVVYVTGYYSVLSEYPEERICFKSHFNPWAVVEEIKKIFEDF
jgi:CheY-like chemotaxis protein